MSANRRIALVVIVFALGITALVFWVKRPKPIDVLVTTVENGEVEIIFVFIDELMEKRFDLNLN